jgi:hypothetical protein
VQRCGQPLLARVAALVLFLAVAMLVLVGCETPAPTTNTVTEAPESAGRSTPTVDVAVGPTDAVVTTPSTIETAPSPTSAGPSGTALPTVTPVPTRAPESTSTSTPKPTVAPTPTPLQLMTVAFPGIPNIYLDYPDNTRARGLVWFRVEANDNTVSPPTNGNDIKSVEFQIKDAKGNVVSDQLEMHPAYCAFGGDDPICPSWIFSAHGNKWPNGQTVQNGQQYTLKVTATSSQGSNTQTFTFVVKL